MKERTPQTTSPMPPRGPARVDSAGRPPAEGGPVENETPTLKDEDIQTVFGTTSTPSPKAETQRDKDTTDGVDTTDGKDADSTDSQDAEDADGTDTEDADGKDSASDTTDADGTDGDGTDGDAAGS
jgi:hypothetical protein